MTRPIDAAVQPANSKLAQFLLAREEEEMLLQIGKRKPKQPKEEKLPGGRGRWAGKPDFRKPTPLVDRPRTTAGATSYHFSYISISKEGVPTSGGSPLPGFSLQLEPAFDHSKYIERPGAAEVSFGAKHAAYLERRGAIERVPGLPQNVAAVDAGAIQDELLSSSAISSMFGWPSVFSNISDDPFERQEFWRAVERRAKTPRTHSIVVDPAASPGWWEQLQKADHLHPQFRIHALQVRSDYERYLTQPEQSDGKQRRFSAEPYKVGAEEAGEIILAAATLPFEGSPPFRFKSGPGGILQFRIVAELPHELSPEDRALIVQNFCDLIDSLEDRGGKKVGLMYTAVVHAPDAHNDRRNYHLHIVAHDRPARFIPELGQWDFEIAEYYIDPGSGKERVRYPHEQPKIRAANGTAPGADPAKCGKNFIPYLRGELARITNEVLKARGIGRSLDPRKYLEMGIDRTPTEHLGTKAAALEAIGVPTAVGDRNGISIWRDSDRAIQTRISAAAEEYRRSQEEFWRTYSRVVAVDARHPELLRLGQLIRERERLGTNLAEDLGSIAMLDHLEAKAKSRAVRTLRTCVQLLSEIGSGAPDGPRNKAREQIEKRSCDAQAHLDAIDEALEPTRDLVMNAAIEVFRRERQFESISESLALLVATMEEWLEATKAAAAKEPTAEPTSVGLLTASPPAFEQASTPTPALPGSGAQTAAPQREYGLGYAPSAAASITVQPVTIEGIPIVASRLPPREARPTNAASHAGTPEGLTPLRPPKEVVQVRSEPEVIVEDMEVAPKEVAQAPTLEADTPPDGMTREDVAPVGTTQSTNVQPVVDETREQPCTAAAANISTEPAPPTEKPPVSDPEPNYAGVQKSRALDPKATAATTQASLRRALAERLVSEHGPEAQAPKAKSTWEEVVKRIAASRIPIQAERLDGSAIRFTVPSLTSADRQVLHAPRLALRTNNRLAAIYEHQQHEVQRLLSWITAHGQNANALIIESRRVSLGPDVREAVRTLFHHWNGHALVREALRIENKRRLQRAKERAQGPSSKHEQVDVAHEERKCEAARLYPTPDQAYTPEVRDFIILLRDLAPEADLRAAASKIEASGSAREDVTRHTVELATAYRLHSEAHQQMAGLGTGSEIDR